MLHSLSMINPDRFTDSERSAFYDAIQYLDPGNQYIITAKENDSLDYNESRIQCHKRISGKPSDRELTRAFVLLLIMIKYKWPCYLIEIENCVPAKGDNQTGDVSPGICIKNENGDREILCTVQSIYEYWNCTDTSFERLLFYPFKTIVPYSKAEKLSYLSMEVPVRKNHFPLYCLGICTRKIKSFNDWTIQGRPFHFFDFPVYKAEQKPYFSYTKLHGKKDDKYRKDLDQQFNIKKCRRIWIRLWDVIWGGTLEDNRKFENFNKVLLAKIYDEQKTKNGTPYIFQIKTRAGMIQTEDELAFDIDLLYRHGYRENLARERDIDLFGIKGIDFEEFPPYLIAQCVRFLQSISFFKNRYTNTDILGEFYEIIIRKAFKQTKGLFLTHPNIVLFILAALDIETLVQGEKLPYIIDPSCGTGSFLILFLQYIRKYPNLDHSVISDNNVDPKDPPVNNFSGDSSGKQAVNRIEDYIYGIDKEEVLARACRLNLILHGDGKRDINTHIINMDGLCPIHSFPADEIKAEKGFLPVNINSTAEFYGKTCLNKFDIIVSNPPFNTVVNRPEIQDSFTISGKSEIYFLERWYQLLKPGGRLGVVLPECFFSVDDALAGRLFLFRHFTIKAIVSLPNHAFQPHTNINTSLLFAVKKTRDEESEFIHKWETFAAMFEHYVNDIISLFPEIPEMERKAKECLGAGFISFPFFESGIVCSPEKNAVMKKAIKNTLLKNNDRWILKKISIEREERFYNFSVREIGYKAGKKGSKNRPNELITLYDRNNNRIHDLKYSHEWKRIDQEDRQTVLGKLKALGIWQPEHQMEDLTGTGGCNDREIICEGNNLTNVCRFRHMRCDTHFTHYIRRSEGFFLNGKIEWITLGSVLDKIRNGINVSTAYYSTEKTGIHYLSVTQVKEDGLSFRQRIYLTEEIRKLDYFYELKENMIIITRSGTIGIALSTNHPSFRFKNTTYVPSGFLITAMVKPGYSADVIAHYINLPDVKNYLNAMASGVCQKNISQPVITDLPIPEVLLDGKNAFRNLFSEYEEKRMEIQDCIKTKEKELIELSNQMAESVKKKICEFYK